MPKKGDSVCDGVRADASMGVAVTCTLDTCDGTGLGWKESILAIGAGIGWGGRVAVVVAARSLPFVASGRGGGWSGRRLCFQIPKGYM